MAGERNQMNGWIYSVGLCGLIREGWERFLGDEMTGLGDGVWCGGGGGCLGIREGK